MKRITRSLLLMWLVGMAIDVFANPGGKSFEGEWGLFHGDIDFGIHLHQTGNQLTGYHSV